MEVLLPATEVARGVVELEEELEDLVLQPVVQTVLVRLEVLDAV